MEDNFKVLREQIDRAMADKEIPQIYFNGFIVSSGSADVTVVLQRNNRPVAILNTSYTVAKTLITNLGNLIANFENVTEKPIMTTSEIDEKIKGTQNDDNK